MMKPWCLTFIFFASIVSAGIHVEVNDPTYKDGVLFTTKGGVIESDKMRVQAENLELREVDGQKILSAKGDLFLIYGKKFFIGDSFEYNFSTRQGTLENGVCNAEGVFTSGNHIVFNGDGTLKMEGAHLTTSENRERPLTISAKEVTMDEKYTVNAKGIKLSAFDTPLVYVPSYSRNVNKKFQNEPTVSYRTLWERGQGPLFLMRYKAWDNDGLKVFWRGEVRTGDKSKYYAAPRGAGTALEIDYDEPSNELFKFAARNFYAYDTFYNDTNPNKFKHRYRIQGSFNSAHQDKHIETFGRWDALSDRNMRSDFPTQLFELATLERTEGFIKARYDTAFTSIYVRPRINTFQGFKQELPTLKVAVKPFVIPNTGAIFENYFKLGYLDYVYANTLHNDTENFSSGRLETFQSIVRPFQLGFLHMTPKAAFKGIFYSDTPDHSSQFKPLFQYDFTSHATFDKNYTHFNHAVKPYLDFQGLLNPTNNTIDPYIFSVQDGYRNINQVKLGLKNSFFNLSEFKALPTFEADLYAYNFLDAKTFQTPFPKGYLDLTWNYPSASLQSNFGWNFEKNTYDHANLALSFTLNEYVAAALELRHRGKYEWKKDIFSNYMLDVAEPIDSLENSPLSDERTSFLTRWQIQLSPLTTLQVQNHFGWRPNQPFYHESKFDLYTTITNTWKLRLSYTRTVRTNQYSFGITLI